MANIYHANARTTSRVRQEIQDSQESIAALAARLNLNPKTIMKWKHAGRTSDAKSGPKNPRSTVLTPTEEQVICEFRRVTRLSIDDIFVSLRDRIPRLTRSNLHRCLQRHGLSRLPDDDAARPEKSKKKFKDYEIGYVHIDITEVRVEARKLYMFVGICRVCKFAYVELHDRMTTEIAVQFLRNMIDECPFKIHTILTDNGIQFTYELLADHLRPRDRMHAFDALCAQHHIDHRLTKFRHPWTNGQVEVMNRIIKNHTTKNYYYDTAEALKKHLMAFLMVYNYQRPLRALKFLSPYDKIIDIWNKKPYLFRINPYHKTTGLNS